MIKQKLEVWVKCSSIVAILMVVLTLWSSGDDSGITITVNDIRTPVEVRLVHGTLVVASAVVNHTINLDMLVDTGSFKTYVTAEIFGNLNGEVYISSLCLENGVCFNNFWANSSDSAFTQSKKEYFNGIIGVDLLNNFDVTFDYQNGLMVLYDTFETDSSDRVAISFDYNAFVPYANVSIEGLPQGYHLLDTGSVFTNF